MIENTFGKAASRFRILRRPIIAGAQKVTLITKAIVVLHNFLMKTNAMNNNSYCPSNVVDHEGPSGIRGGEWRKDNDAIGLQPIQRLGSNNYSQNAATIRQDYMNYFNNEGELEWQWQLVNRTVTSRDVFLDE